MSDTLPLFLVPHVGANRRLIQSDRAYTVASRPKVLSGEPLLHTQRLAVNLDRRFPLQRPNHQRHAEFRWDPQHPVDVVGHRLSFHDLHPLLPAQRAQNRPDPLARPTVQNLLAVLRNEHNVVLRC